MDNELQTTFDIENDFLNESVLDPEVEVYEVEVIEDGI